MLKKERIERSRPLYPLLPWALALHSSASGAAASGARISDRPRHGRGSRPGQCPTLWSVSWARTMRALKMSSTPATTRPATPGTTRGSEMRETPEGERRCVIESRRPVQCHAPPPPLVSTAVRVPLLLLDWRNTPIFKTSGSCHWPSCCWHCIAAEGDELA